MEKRIRKQFFTEELSKYKRFLEASDVNIKASIHAMQREIDMHNQICALITKYQTTGDVDKKDLQKLAQTSCPDFVTMHAFEQLNDGTIASLDEVFDVPTDDIVINCSQTKCETCWKNYINQMARLLNQSSVEVKLYDDLEGDTDGSPDTEN